MGGGVKGALQPSGRLPHPTPKIHPGVPLRFAVLLVAGFLAVPVLSAQHSVPSDGQWLIEPADHSGKVQLTIRYGEGRHSSNWGRDVPLSEPMGLSAADMGGSGATVHFKIVRSAGTLTCEGWFEGGRGSGHFTYQANPDFVAELAKRGINAPTAWEQFQITIAGLGLEVVDELQRQGYARPTAAELALVASRDHGVDPTYIRSLKEAGYERLSLPELRRARDHGVTRAFIQRVKARGYGTASIDEVIRLRDRGLD